MIEYLGWQVRLWLAGLGERVYLLRKARQARKWRSGWDIGPYARFVDRVSPWIGADGRGYRHTTLRVWLWRLRRPRQHLVDLALDKAQQVIARILPVVIERRGRYENNDAVIGMKAEWLDANTELAQDTTGDSDEFGVWLAMFEVVPPWSRTVEFWLLSTDRQGFVIAEQFVGWTALLLVFQRTDREYAEWFQPEGEFAEHLNELLDEAGFEVEPVDVEDERMAANDR